VVNSNRSLHFTKGNRQIGLGEYRRKFQAVCGLGAERARIVLRVPVNGPQNTGFWQNERNREKYQDWLAVDAVPCELFSGPNSLLTGKNTGNFAPLPGTIER
jgi:hypothetical protein